MESYLCPTLSLPTQLELEVAKRAAAKMSRDQLVAKAQELIETWYLQSAILDGALGEIRQLQAKLALAGPPVPSKREPDPEHFAMARELMALMGQT
jgi:hypothetical protein